MAGDDLRMKLLYLENRESLARFLFPNEAQVIMGIAQVDDTLRLPLYAMSLNETPSLSIEEQVALIERITAVSKSVELGRRYFPRCNEALDKIMDSEDLLEVAGYNSNLPEEREMKRKKFMELQDLFKMAFDQDKQESISSSIPI
ncbi:hypothetical protein MKW94_026178 [Papaver nudicaule]|uniref:NPR1/NIM1-like C-terminal domain-containing protein n=1 Tax=Papaver nudicaule TaxID=74823 RepID=A0AA41W044_PAPNU|nr:hypothetical protein [Papaver nudicaule]